MMLVIFQEYRSTDEADESHDRAGDFEEDPRAETETQRHTSESSDSGTDVSEEVYLVIVHTV